MNEQSMKKAEEWKENRLFLIGQLAYCAETKDWKRAEALIKMHEIDAYKAGMTEAAEIAGSKIHEWEGDKP